MEWNDNNRVPTVRVKASVSYHYEIPVTEANYGPGVTLAMAEEYEREHGLDELLAALNAGQARTRVTARGQYGWDYEPKEFVGDDRKQAS